MEKLSKIMETYFREEPARETLPKSELVQQIEEFANNKEKRAEVIKAFTREKSEQKKFNASADSLMAQQITVARTFSFLFPIVFLIANVGQALVLYFGGRMVLGGDAFTIGQLVTFVALVGIIFSLLFIVPFALGIAIGSGYLFPTTFQREVYSDLTGERGVLMGALAGIMEAQYNTLRGHGHSPSEAFNETVEELTQSLIRLVDQNGMDWMYENCSATARRGALDWRGRFRDAVVPVFDALYDSVVSGEETRIVLEANSAADYKEKLDAELTEMRESEMWRAGAAVRSLRPTNW